MGPVTRKLRALVLATVATALSGGLVRAEPGITDNEIRIGMWTPLSGPVALLRQSARDGVRVWVKDVNDRGGIHGRKINFISYDDAGSPQERKAQDDTLMIKPSKRSFSQLIFPNAGHSLTKLLKNFTMTPDFGPRRAAVAWENAFS